MEIKMNLTPVITQDARTKEVLMLAYANEEALQKSKETGYAWYWSRSRNKLWMKGETSGNTQKIVEIRDDCDNDALLYIVEQKGVACHTGKYSCFSEKKPFTLAELEQIIEQRKLEKPDDSYTMKLLGDEQLLRSKILEEAAELCQAAKKEGKQRTIEEAADLLYFMLVLLTSKDIFLQDILSALEKRRK